jgi:uncharacterized protein DUF3467
MAEENEKEKEIELEVPEGALANTASQLRIKTDRHTRIYTNNLAIRFSSWDISLLFGEIVGTQENKAVIEELAHITMSREFAKVMSVLLTKNIQAFEQEFGEIRIPTIAETAGVVDSGDETLIQPEQSVHG